MFKKETIVFIDDSGDPGFKFDKGSSSHFVIAMVIFDDFLEVEKTALAIKTLKRELGFSDFSEFKFFKSQRRVRINFLETIIQFKFIIRLMVVNKGEIYSHQLKNSKNSFYSFFIKEVLKHNDGDIVNGRIRIDGSGDKIFKKNFVTYLRKELNLGNVKVFKNFKMVDSQSDVMIQMADMIAGSILRSYNKEKEDASEYKKIFQKHIKDEWLFK